MLAVCVSDVMNEDKVAMFFCGKISNTSRANVFLLSIGKEQTNMAAPKGLTQEAIKYFLGISIDRTKWKPLLQIFSNCLRFQAILRHHFGSLFSPAELNTPNPIGNDSTGAPQSKELWKSFLGYEIVTGIGPNFWSN